METERYDYDSNELIKMLGSALEGIQDIIIEGPGVYAVELEGRGKHYIVERNTETISDAAKKYGKTIPNLPDGLLYQCEAENSGSMIIEYELARNKAHSGTKQDTITLRKAAVYGMERYPDYFGAFPAPTITPWGYMLRYLSIDNGILWIETDQCKQCLAVCYPAWTGDLSADAKMLGMQTEFDRNQGIDNTLGYLFFSEQDACVAIFELLDTRIAWRNDPRIHIPALMNAVCLYHPEYALGYNTREQLGVNEWLAHFIGQFGAEIRETQDRIIFISPDAGVEYLLDPATASVWSMRQRR